MEEDKSCVLWESDVELHSHCETCVRAEDCRPREGLPGLGCPLLPCPQSCWAQEMHACKIEDHLLLCPNLLVPCINEGYGCPDWMERRETGPHLRTCPASIVVCSMERSRPPLSQSAKREMKRRARRQTQPTTKSTAEDDTGPDEALALADERKVGEMYARFNSRQIKGYRDSFNPTHPLLPLRVKADMNSEMVRGESGRNSDGIDSSDEEAVAAKRKFLQGIAPVMRDCYLCRVDPGSQHLHVLGNASAGQWAEEAMGNEIKALEKKLEDRAAPLPAFYQSNGLHLSIVPEFFPAQTKKPNEVFTFICGHQFRRDDFHWHYRNVHNDVIPSLDGWLLSRCPLAHLGCRAWAQRLLPTPSLGGVGFNPVLDTFVFAPHPPSPRGEKRMEWTALPSEVLLHIFGFLDSASLFCVSLVSRKLRKLAFQFVSEDGIVDRAWIRTVTTDWTIRWIQGPPRWSFTRMPDKARSWTISPSAWLHHHLKQCPFYERKTFPELKYHVMLPGPYQLKAPHY